MIIQDMDAFVRWLPKIHVNVSEKQADQLNRYYHLIREWNTRINLISRKEVDFFDRHFVNSACIAYFCRFNHSDRVIDIGSGGGFPAVVLKILFPEAEFVLVDSVKKKSSFLNQVIEDLELKKIRIMDGRIETLMMRPSLKRSFTHVTARAVGPLSNLVRYGRALLRPGGKMLFLKGKTVDKEFRDLPGGLRYNVLSMDLVPGTMGSQTGVLWMSEIPGPDK